MCYTLLLVFKYKVRSKKFKYNILFESRIKALESAES